MFLKLHWLSATEKIINMILWLHSNEFMFVLFSRPTTFTPPHVVGVPTYSTSYCGRRRVNCRSDHPHSCQECNVVEIGPSKGPWTRPGHPTVPVTWALSTGDATITSVLFLYRPNRTVLCTISATHPVRHSGRVSLPIHVRQRHVIHLLNANSFKSTLQSGYTETIQYS